MWLNRCCEVLTPGNILHITGWEPLFISLDPPTLVLTLIERTLLGHRENQIDYKRIVHILYYKNVNFIFFDNECLTLTFCGIRIKQEIVVHHVLFLYFVISSLFYSCLNVWERGIVSTGITSLTHFFI